MGSALQLDGGKETMMEGTYGSEASRIKRQLEYADALRKQGLEVPEDTVVRGTSGPLGALPNIIKRPGFADYAAPALRGLIGGYFSGKAENEQKALEAKAAKEASEFVLPSMMKTLKKTTTAPGEDIPVDQSGATTPSGDVMPGTMLPQARAQFMPGPDVTTTTEEQVTKSIPEYADDLAAASRGIDITNPYMAPQREAILKQTMRLPEFALEQEQKAADAATALAEKMTLAREKLAADSAAKLRDAKNDEDRNRILDENKKASLKLEEQIAKMHDETLRAGQANAYSIAKLVQSGKTDAAAAKAKAKANPQETQMAAKKALEIAGVGNVDGKEVDAMSDLIGKSTSGGLETVLAGTKEWVTGSGTSGQEAIASLATKANSITFDLLNGKLGAGISNADVKFLQSTLGEVADSSKGANVRLKAWKQAKARLQKIANGDFVPAEASAPTGGGYGKPPAGAVVEVTK